MSDASNKGPDLKYGEHMKRTNLTLPPHLRAYARDIGDNGSMSDGVRKALEEHMQRRSVKES